MRAILFFGLATLAIGGCDRTHMRPDSYGQSVRRALKAQVIDPAAGDRPAREQGLDPEEAAIVSKSYRESLSPKKEEGARTPLLVTPNVGAGGMPLTPAPVR